MRRAHGLRSAGLLLLALAPACHGRPPATPLAGSWHRLERGETLEAVASRFRVPLEDLVEINGLADARAAGEGSQVFVPAPVTAAPRRRPGRLLPPAAVTARSAPHLALSWPARAAVTSLFGPRDGRPHDGIDLAVPDGTPVRSAASGRVVYAGDRVSGYGRMLIVDHGGGLSTVYAHNEALLVGEGATVGSGQTIARSGHSGRATAPHLHFEVRLDGEAIDPLPLLRRPAPAAPPAAPPGTAATNR